MARDDIQIDVGARWSGEAALKRAASQVEGLGRGLDGGVRQAQSSWQNLTLALGVVGASFLAVSRVAGKAMEAIGQGAQLATITQRFDKLSESIGTTADVMLSKLRDATHGMISDAELMSSASQIMSLRLADNQEQVTRLATVVGTLGWDMQQVILTFANMSTMRLDALGLSVEEVKTKAAELRKEGLSAGEAFKEAVIQAGEARLEIGGVSEAEQSLKQATAAVNNFRNSLLLSITTTLEQAGAFEELSRGAQNMNAMGAVRAEMEKMRASGELSFLMWLKLNDMIAGGSSAAAIEAELNQIKIRAALTDTEGELRNHMGAWETWARVVSVTTGVAAEQAAANMNAIFRGLIGISNGLGDNAPFMPREDTFDYMAAGARAGRRYASQQAMAERQARIERNTAYAGVGQSEEWWAAGRQARQEMEYATETAVRYGGAMSYVSEEEQRAAEARQRFVSAFNAEIGAKPEDGLITAEGVVNVEAMNQALYEQVEAAGASAATLALLGVATGQFSEEQAEAALKAAILQEQINQIAEAVVGGQMTLEAALGQLGQVQANLNQADLITVAQGVQAVPEANRTVQVEADTTLAEGAIDGVQSSLTLLTDSPYLATLDVDIDAVLTGADAAKRALEGVPSSLSVTINWAQAGADVIAALRALGIMT